MESKDTKVENFFSEMKSTQETYEFEKPRNVTDWKQSTKFENGYFLQCL